MKPYKEETNNHEKDGTVGGTARRDHWYLRHGHASEAVSAITVVDELELLDVAHRLHLKWRDTLCKNT